LDITPLNEAGAYFDTKYRENSAAATSQLSIKLTDSTPSPDGNAADTGRPVFTKTVLEASETLGGPSDTSSLPMPSNQTMSFQVAQAISSLQRENLLLRNELDFELWLKAQTSLHTSFLYKNFSRTRAETEAESLKRVNFSKSPIFFNQIASSTKY
jgi:hypothetical protein